VRTTAVSRDSIEKRSASWRHAVGRKAVMGRQEARMGRLMILSSHKTIDASPSSLRPVEDEILESTGCHSVFWCGRGASALYWAFRVARARRPDVMHPEVVLPAALCASPANAAIAAGLKVRFADVDPGTALTNESYVSERINNRTVAVVFVHLYGRTAALKELADVCGRHNAMLIEDAAQALGGRLPDGTPVGSVGDACVFSFSATKILECGGGVLTLRTEEEAAVLEAVSANYRHDAPMDEAVVRRMSESFRNLQHGAIALLRLRKIKHCATWFLPLLPKYRGLLVRPLRQVDKIIPAWTSLPQTLRHRQEMANIYAERLAGGPWRLPLGYGLSGVCWRYTILVDDNLDALDLTDGLRQDGFLASNHYWPLPPFYHPEDECGNAENFARHCLNLWVDGKMDGSTTGRCADKLWSLVKQWFRPASRVEKTIIDERHTFQ